MSRFLFALLSAVLLIVPAGADAQRAAVQVGEIVAEPGTRVSGFLEIPAGIDAATRVPVTLVHGRRDGPTLALIAGTHGAEYPGITALQNLRTTLSPDALSGTVIIVHVANLPAFLGRSVYVNPVDGENLNRVYPGDPDGTQSARIAHAITTEVIEAADALVDLHAGDGNEALRPYVYMPRTGDAAYDARARALALAFGLDTIVIDDVDPAQLDPPGLTDLTAVARGIPAITTETGELGGNEPRYVALALAGIDGVLRHLGMLPGAPRPNPAPVWLDDYEVVRAPATGVFRAAVEDGWSVAENGRLGDLLDLFGEPIAEIRAPFAGVVNYVVGTPPVSEGEPVAMVSRLASDPARDDRR